MEIIINKLNDELYNVVIKEKSFFKRLEIGLKTIFQSTIIFDMDGTFITYIQDGTGN